SHRYGAQMRIGVPKESQPGERRVALVPASVGRLAALGFEVAVEPGAGVEAGHPDAEYADAGATVTRHALQGADVLAGVRAPTVEQVRRLADGAVTVSFLPTATELDLVRELRDRGH